MWALNVWESHRWEKPNVSVVVRFFTFNSKNLTVTAE